MRTVNCVAMREARLWVVLATLQCMLAATGGVHHRRSMVAPTTLPVSKGGWRPVLSSGLPGYGAFGAAPLHAAPYKFPIADTYHSSSRPVPARDQAKLTSIAQSYRPTTLRSLPASSPPQNQPINSYYNPYLPNALTYKYVQNYPIDNVVIRNPHNPYAARPVYPKYQKYKQNYHQGLMQQLNNVQPIQFGVQYQPHEYEKPVEVYARPQHPPIENSRPQHSDGSRPQYSDGSRPQHSDGNRPQHQEGSRPQHQEGSRPQHQEGSRPQHQEGSRPQHQEGSRPQHQEGSRPQHPDGSRLQHPDGSRPQHQEGSRLHPQGDSRPQHTQAEHSKPHAHEDTRPQHFPQGDPRPHTQNEKKPAKQSSNSGTEIYKPEVYKVHDSDTSPQQTSQQVKTAQQQSSVNLKPQINGYPQYQFQDEKFAPIPTSLLGSFSSFGLQSVKGRDPIYQPAKTTYLPPQPIKQTIFNSFSFAPHFKGTPSFFPNTTPNLQYTHLMNYGLQSDAIAATQPPKAANAQKVDPNAPNFKPSPQDPFQKQFPKNDLNKIPASTYKPNLQTTTSVTSFYNTNFHLPSQYHQSVQTQYFNQPQFHYENKKQKIHDNLGASGNQQPSTQVPSLPHKKLEFETAQNSLPRPSTYEVTEEFEHDDIVTHPANPWTSAPETHDYQHQQQQQPEEPATSAPAELPEEYAIVTEADKGYENSLNYDNHVETQSRRPLGDDFEPINKHKLRDYYYKVSTPTYDVNTHYKRTKKPTEEPSSTFAAEQEATTADNSLAVQPLPTLPPNKHFKRPSAGDAVDKDKIRKRVKNRRRRPPPANLNKDKEESSTNTYVSSTQAPHDEEPHTLRPRVRPFKTKPKVNLTTPTITTDLSTSALPTISPTSPTNVKKKTPRRPLTTTTDRAESTTTSFKDDVSKDSPIMKIATRPQHPRVTTATYDYKPSEAPDYTHKQDEKDTPTSDISVDIESYRNKPEQNKPFSFHKDVKPLEAKLEPIQTTTDSRIQTLDDFTDLTTYPPRTETTSERSQRPRKNKYDTNRPKFSVKDYRNRLSSTTSTEKPASTESSAPKFRFPSRRLPFDNKFSSDSDNSTERKKFTPKDPKHKPDEPVTEKDKEIQPRQTTRQRQTTTESDGTTQKISARIRNGLRRPRPTEETTDTSSPLPTTVHIKRPQRKKVKDSETEETVQDVAITETTLRYHDDPTSERTRSESAIMKIAKDDKKHQTDNMDIFEHSKRVSDLTLAASKDYNNPGLFKTVSPNSRRVPSYFTIATDDPILPIEAFFPQLNQKKES